MYMDDEYRKAARHLIHTAAFLSWINAINVYGDALKNYEKIVNKTEDDIRAISFVNESIAICYFNLPSPDYEQAAHYYWSSIQSLLQVTLTDKDFRILTGRYIDLSDAFSHLFNESLAHEAISNAINAFKAIKDKTKEELKIGDPNDNDDNFEAFRNYFEKKSSTDSYIKSSAFKNHGSLLQEKNAQHQMMSLFNGISISSENLKKELDIEELLSGLTISNQKSQQLFTPITMGLPTNDMNRRSMAIHLLQLAKTHIQSDRLLDTINTFEQVLNALCSIQEKDDSDKKAIELIQKEATLLRKLNSETSNTTIQPNAVENHRTYTHLISTLGLFGQSSDQLLPMDTFAPDPDEEDSNNMDWSY